MTKWANEKLKYLKWSFGEFYEYAIWTEQTDDRRLYVNVYNMVCEAIEAVKDIDNNFVQVALNKKIRQEQEMLSGIKKSFWDKFKKNIV